MAESLTVNTIERLARALLATLTPITGVRATGSVTVTGLDGAELLPRNTYLIPVVGGQVRDDLLYKTVAEAGFRGAGEASIAITSNVGGSRHNLPAGTVFRFDPPVPLFEPTATLEASMTDGSDEGVLLRSVAYFEELDSANPGKDIFSAKLGEFPGAMLIWADSEPAEGALAGLRQGSNRGGRRVKYMRENYVLYVVLGRLAGDSARRQQGTTVLQAITRLLTDRMQNDDGEQLSSVGGGVDITGRARLRRSESHYIYGLRLRVNQALQAFETRSFGPWETTRYTGTLPPRDVQEDPLVILDDTEAMP